jgi:hypothetical protein
VGEMRKLYNILVEKPERMRLARISRHRRRDNIKMYLRKYSLGVWIGFIWLEQCAHCYCHHESPCLNMKKFSVFSMERCQY